MLGLELNLRPAATEIPLILLHHSGNSYMKYFYFIYFIFCLFAIYWAAPTAYGGSQARGLNGVVVTRLRQSHSNVGSELRL